MLNQTIRPVKLSHETIGYVMTDVKQLLTEHVSSCYALHVPWSMLEFGVWGEGRDQ